MSERDPQSIIDMEGTGGPIAFTVSQGRVEHYADVVEHMVNTEVARCKAKGFNPSQQQIDFLRKEVIRYAVIRRDVVGATKLQIREGSNILNEANNRIPARAEL